MSGRLQTVSALNSVALCRGVVYPSWGLAEELLPDRGITLPIEVCRRPNGTPYVMVRLNRGEAIQVELDTTHERSLATATETALVARIVRHEPAGAADTPPAVVVEISKSV